MVSIRKQKLKGKWYYSLIKRVKKKGKWTYETLESYGTSPPVKYKPIIIKGFVEAELKQIPDESVNLIIIDPPYGIEFDTNYREGENIGKISLDNEKIFETFPEVVRECYRVLKDGGALYSFSRWDVTGRFIAILSKYFVVKNRLNWVKNNWSMGDLTGAYASQQEDIIFAVKGRHILNKKIDKKDRHTDVLNFSRVPSSEYHSHQKPVELLDFLIKKSSKRGDTILDLYAGSGSTTISAVNLGRKSIAIELNDKYLNIINERLEKECYSKIKGIDWRNKNG